MQELLCFSAFLYQYIESCLPWCCIEGGFIPLAPLNLPLIYHANIHIYIYIYIYTHTYTYTYIAAYHLQYVNIQDCGAWLKTYSGLLNWQMHKVPFVCTYTYTMISIRNVMAGFHDVPCGDRWLLCVIDTVSFSEKKWNAYS